MKNEYTSKYGANGSIGAPQFLVEFIMERIAAKDKRNLPVKFWSHEDWKKIFLAQINHANKLLKAASCVEIMNALRHKDLRAIYSLGLKKQILDKVKQLSINTDISVDCIQGDVLVDDWIEQIPDNEIIIDEPKTKQVSLWEKLDG